jgi:hypothetical protein
MATPRFRSLDSAAIAADIRAAQFAVCYAAPGHSGGGGERDRGGGNEDRG